MPAAMQRFVLAHATHPQWRMAAALVVAQLRAQMAMPGRVADPALALLYITDHYAPHAPAILEHLCRELPEIDDWAGSVGVGTCATGVEYFDEPAMAVLACDLPPGQFRVFSGVAPLPPSGVGTVDGFQAHTALVHADGTTPDLGELLADLAGRTATGYLFGGLSSGRWGTAQFAHRRGAAGGVFEGGLSGVAFGPQVEVFSRVTQGARPIGAWHVVTRAEGNVVFELDQRPALDVLLAEAGIDLAQPGRAMHRLRSVLVGLSAPGERRADGTRAMPGQFGDDVEVRHIVGLDPARHGVAVAHYPEPGVRLAFCERHVAAARADLVRVCTEIREEFEPRAVGLGAGPGPEGGGVAAVRRMLGAVYVSCSGRGGPHFGGPSAELQIVRRALGDVPLVGFFAGGEIARHHLYGYTGVLTVFAG
jgi:small ligand-binding sensory domain FIST